MTQTGRWYYFLFLFIIQDVQVEVSGHLKQGEDNIISTQDGNTYIVRSGSSSQGKKKNTFSWKRFRSNWNKFCQLNCFFLKIIYNTVCIIQMLSTSGNNEYQ